MYVTELGNSLSFYISTIEIHKCFFCIGAIQRYYESRHRSWRESTDPTQQQRVARQAKNRRSRSRKLRVSNFSI